MGGTLLCLQDQITSVRITTAVTTTGAAIAIIIFTVVESLFTWELGRVNVWVWRVADVGWCGGGVGKSKKKAISTK